MIQFKLNGEPLSIPTAWDELTTSQYLQILDLKDDYLQVVSILSGMDYEIIKKAEINGLEHLIIATSFLQKPADFGGTCDKVGSYTLHKNDKGQFNIQFESLAQFEDMRNVMKSCVDAKTTAQAFPKFVSIYLQKIRDGEYSYSKAMEMVTEVLTLPAKEVIITGSFFYVKLRSLLNGTPATSLPISPSPKKKKPVSKGSRKSSGRR